MYVADISLSKEDLVYRLTPSYKEYVVDETMLSTLRKLDAFKTDFDIAMRVDLELKFLSEIIEHRDISMFQVTDIYTIDTMNDINKCALEYEKCYIIKPFLSNPLDMSAYIICCNMRELHEKIKYKNITNNMTKMKRFIYMIAANAEIIFINKMNQAFIRRRLKYASMFQSALKEKYEQR